MLASDVSRRPAVLVCFFLLNALNAVAQAPEWASLESCEQVSNVAKATGTTKGWLKKEKAKRACEETMNGSAVAGHCAYECAQGKCTWTFFEHHKRDKPAFEWKTSRTLIEKKVWQNNNRIRTPLIKLRSGVMAFGLDNALYLITSEGKILVKTDMELYGDTIFEASSGKIFVTGILSEGAADNIWGHPALAIFDEHGKQIAYKKFTEPGRGTLNSVILAKGGTSAHLLFEECIIRPGTAIECSGTTSKLELMTITDQGEITMDRALDGKGMFAYPDSVLGLGFDSDIWITYQNGTASIVSPNSAEVRDFTIQEPGDTELDTSYNAEMLPSNDDHLTIFLHSSDPTRNRYIVLNRDLSRRSARIVPDTYHGTGWPVYRRYMHVEATLAGEVTLILDRKKPWEGPNSYWLQFESQSLGSKRIDFVEQFFGGYFGFGNRMFLALSVDSATAYTGTTPTRATLLDDEGNKYSEGATTFSGGAFGVMTFLGDAFFGDYRAAGKGSVGLSDGQVGLLSFEAGHYEGKDDRGRTVPEDRYTDLYWRTISVARNGCTYVPIPRN